MNSIYQDLLEGFREIGLIEGNEELVSKAEELISESKVKYSDNYVAPVTRIVHPSSEMM